jgi:hypothetical protein
MLVLGDRRLRILTQLVKGGVRQVEPTIADRQPAVGIIYDGDTLAVGLLSLPTIPRVYIRSRKGGNVL